MTPEQSPEPVELPARRASALGQTIVVGCLAFCGSGLFNALSGLGKAGSPSVVVGALAQGALYFTLAISSFFSGAVFNVAGPAPMFFVGGCAYAVYSMCVYFSAQHVWLSPVGGFVLGIGAALFWTAQGALIMAYSTSESRGRLIGIFWAIFNFGGVLGGLMEAALNWTSEQNDGANPLSYFVMTGIMLLGPVLTVLLLAKPENVIRADGSPVVLTAAGTPKDELRAAVAALRYPFVLLSLPFFFFSNWFYTYDFDGFNSAQFNVRTRGLNSALFWLAQMLAASILGDRLDSKAPLKRRATLGLFAVVASLVVSLGPAIWINFYIECHGHTGWQHGWDKDAECKMDVVTDFPTSLFPVLVFILLGSADAMFQTYAYWLMSSAAGTSVRHAVMYSAIYKSAQSCGAGVAWLLDLIGGFTYKDQGILAISLCCASCIPVLWTFSKLPEDEDKTPLTQGQEDVSMQ